MRFHDLPADIQLALRMLFPGTVLRIPKPTRPLEGTVRERYDAYTRIYGMSHKEAVREICQQVRIDGRKMRVGEVESLL